MMNLLRLLRSVIATEFSWRPRSNLTRNSTSSPETTKIKTVKSSIMKEAWRPRSCHSTTTSPTWLLSMTRSKLRKAPCWEKRRNRVRSFWVKFKSSHKYSSPLITSRSSVVVSLLRPIRLTLSTQALLSSKSLRKWNHWIKPMNNGRGKPIICFSSIAFLFNVCHLVFRH